MSLPSNNSNLDTGPSPLAIAMAGMLALATAMGIGRFAFTPLLPMMLADGVLDLPSASWLASANYFGYLVGALLCIFQPWLWRRFGFLPGFAASSAVRIGMVATCVLTLSMALHWPSVWPLLRFAAGMASAFVFVFTSGWCLAQLALHRASALGGVMYAGPGAGIAFSGLLASGMVAMHWTAAAGWFVMGTAAVLMTVAVWRAFGQQAPAQPSVPMAPGPSASLQSGHAASAESAGRNQLLLLAVVYGVAGFGYIITATFLPVIARLALPASAWLDLFWPVFGLGVIVGALLASRLPLGGDLRYLLSASYFVQALGVAVSIWSPTLVGFAVSSLLLGIPFTAITFFAMQEVRRLRPQTASSYMALLTAVYGVGQISGPPLVAWLLRHSATLTEGFAQALGIAAVSLVGGAVMYLGMARAYPMRS